MPQALPTTERRRLTLVDSDVHVRDAGADDKPSVFVGYASKFNERAAIGNPLRGGFYEQVAPGAFTKAISEGDQRFLVDHDTAKIVARSSAGSLRLSQDGTGLRVEADLDKNLSYVNDLVANLRNGNITGMSFGFSPVKHSTQYIDVPNSDGGSSRAVLRTLHEVRLPEVSAVTFPAYQSTEAQLRSVATALMHDGDMEWIERSVEADPELLKFIEIEGREPGESTRGSEPEKPAASTSTITYIDLGMRALAARFGLPLPE